MSPAAASPTARCATVRMTRHGEPMETMLLARTVWRKPSGPPMARAAPATTANPAASPPATAASRSRGEPGGGRSVTAAGRRKACTAATASPAPTSAMVTLIANPSPVRAPAAAAASAARQAGPYAVRLNIATAATPKKTAWLSMCSPATST